MRVLLIKNKAIYRYKTLFPVLFYLLIILIVILRKNDIISVNMLIGSVIFLLMFSILLNIVSSIRKEVGFLNINCEGYATIKIDEVFSKVPLKTVYLDYSGYKGEFYEAEFLFTMSNGRDGTINYIFVNGEKYQIEIQNKEQRDSLLDLFNDLNELGVSTQFSRMSFLEYLKNSYFIDR